MTTQEIKNRQTVANGYYSSPWSCEDGALGRGAFRVESWPALARSLAPQDEIIFTDLFRRASEEELQHKNI